MESEVIDYYEILQCDRNATLEELKRNYQRLALTCHPDKKISSEDNENFLNIQKAWTVLRDPQSRKEYDALLSCEEHRELLLYDSISVPDLNYNSCSSFYTYQCRCGGLYSVTSSELVPPKTYVECNECSLSIQIDVPS
ncbi:DPH4-like [Papilio xuthus]|uniref:DPH4-like n=1 Tax=Papilio xuthus TaxID=66420 RepID=A0A194PFV8_PAPXU|nr:DPH4-like [Papilio xuthus]